MFSIGDEKQPNYIVETWGWTGYERSECETKEEVWQALGRASFGRIYDVWSPVGLNVEEFIPF